MADAATNRDDEQPRRRGKLRGLYKKVLDAFTPEKPAKAFGDDFLTEAMERADDSYNRERDNIDCGYEDLRFLVGDQWPEWARKKREAKNRPMLTINLLPQYKRQVTGDMRLMRPGIKVSPAGGGAKVEVAELIAGMIRHIETRSEAKAAYAIAADSQVGAGMGHWQVVIEYAAEQGLNKELRIVHVEDGLGVLWDSDAVLPTRQDAMFCFIPVDMSTAKFKRLYPNVNPQDFKAFDKRYHSFWFDSDRVRVAKYWFKKPATRKFAVMVNGTIDDVTDLDDNALAALKSNPECKRVEEREGFKVFQSVITLGHVLEEPEEWPGLYIPVVPLIGEETRIGRKVIRNGIVRNAKDAQRLYNMARTSQAEVMADAPKSPWMGTDKNFREFEDEWDSLNEEAWPYVRYTPDARNGNVAPQRMTPNMQSPANTEAVQMADRDMMGTIGIYQAGLGQRSNETSGKAITARQREADVGTVHYSDNLGMAIRHTGLILVDLIPHVYDTERDVPVRHLDGTPGMVTINKAIVTGKLDDEDEESETAPYDEAPVADNSGLDMAEEESESGREKTTSDDVGNALNDVTVGCYAVDIGMGPGFTTSRQESREGMEAFMKAAPAVAPLILDIYARKQDWPEAEEIADRIVATLPPPVQAMIAKRKKQLGEIQPEEAPPEEAAPPVPSPQEVEQIIAQQVEQRADVAKELASTETARLNLEIKRLDVRKAELELQEKQAEQAIRQAEAAGMAGAAEGFAQLASELAARIETLRGMIEEIVSQLPNPEAVEVTPAEEPAPEIGGPPPAA